MNTADSKPAAPAWTRITDELPNEGDIIACCAEHRDGGMMQWAGRVVEVRQGFATMETRGDETRRFIITFDTLWLRLPSLPSMPVAGPET